MTAVLYFDFYIYIKNILRKVCSIFLIFICKFLFIFRPNFNLKFLPYSRTNSLSFHIMINIKIGRIHNDRYKIWWNGSVYAKHETLTRSDIDPYRANRKYKKWYTTKEFTDVVGGLKLSFPNSRSLQAVSSIPVRRIDPCRPEIVSKPS